VCELGPPWPFVVKGPSLAQAVGRAMDAWVNAFDHV
jgi:hypothetical protein